MGLGRIHFQGHRSVDELFENIGPQPGCWTLSCPSGIVTEWELRIELQSTTPPGGRRGWDQALAGLVWGGLGPSAGSSSRIASPGKWKAAPTATGKRSWAQARSPAGSTIPSPEQVFNRSWVNEGCTEWKETSFYPVGPSLGRFPPASASLSVKWGKIDLIGWFRLYH